MLAIHAYHDNYILPYYLTIYPDQSAYAGSTPDNQTVMDNEVKGQISIYLPLIQWDRWSLNASYTQKAFWQMYAKSPWFRETNYNPQLFVTYAFDDAFSLDLGIDHESNGRGGTMERSWNRVFGTMNYHTTHLSLESEFWYVPVKNEALDSSDPNAPMENYLGNEKNTVGYTAGNWTTKFSVENLEHIEHTSITVSEAYQITDDVALYAQYFYGYGQSLIEYNHLTHGMGVGIKLL